MHWLHDVHGIIKTNPYIDFEVYDQLSNYKVQKRIGLFHASSVSSVLATLWYF